MKLRFHRSAETMMAVLLLAGAATADVTAYATWNSDTGNPAVDAGYADGTMSDPMNQVCHDTNPWYTGASPGSGYVCTWINPEAGIQGNMQMPTIAAGAGWAGTAGLDTSVQGGFAAMVSLNGNATLREDVGGGTWEARGTVRCLNDAEGCIELFFKPNWDPGTDSQVRDVINISDDGWTLRRDATGTLRSIVTNANGVEVGHVLTTDLTANWHYIILAWDADGVRTYLNGVKVGETVYGASTEKVSWRDDQFIFLGGGNEGQGGSAAEMHAADGMYDGLVIRDDVHYTGDTVGLSLGLPEPMTIVSAGTPTATIVVDAEAPDSVNEAVAGLQTYIQKMSGALLPISNSASLPGNLIVVGRHPTALTLVPELDDLDLAHDGFVIRLFPEKLVITGQSEGYRNDASWDTDYGTSNAVYAFLESLGCRWYMPGDDGEIVPNTPTITVSALTDTVSKPDFKSRFAGDHAARSMGGAVFADYADWQRRNRASLTGANLYYSAHTMNHLLPRSYFDTHPEYFALVDGVRRNDRQACTSNSSVRNIVTNNLGPLVLQGWRAYAVGQYDSGWGWCEDALCRADYGDQTFVYPTLQEARHVGQTANNKVHLNAANGYLKFVNDVAGRIAGQYPDLLVTYYALYNIPGFPEVSPRDNVLPVMTHLIPDDEHWRQQVLNWETISRQLLYHTYLGWRIDFPKLGITDDIRFCYQHTGIGVNLEQNAHTPITHLVLYLASKAMWDTDVNSRKLLADFYRDFYGESESLMRTFYEMFYFVTRDALQFGDAQSEYPEALTQDLAENMHQLLSTAYSQTSQDVVRRRILYLSSYWGVVRNHLEARDAMNAWRESRTATNRVIARNRVNEAIGSIGTVASKYFLQYRIALLNAWLAELDASAVVARHIFYNNSAWDGNDPAPGAADDAAVAPDKSAKLLIPGGTVTIANYSSYSRGLNGIMVDMVNMPGTPTATSFQFKVGNSLDPASWATAPAPTSVTVRAGAGGGGTARVTIIWADNAIEDQWLEVTVRATPPTGLSQPHVFYFGNAVGECGNSPADTKVNATDELAARNDPHSVADPAAIDNPHDYNRDKKVDATDEVISRNHPTNFMTELRLIAP